MRTRSGRPRRREGRCPTPSRRERPSRAATAQYAAGAEPATRPTGGSRWWNRVATPLQGKGPPVDVAALSPLRHGVRAAQRAVGPSDDSLLEADSLRNPMSLWAARGHRADHRHESQGCAPPCLRARLFGAMIRRRRQPNGRSSSTRESPPTVSDDELLAVGTFERAHTLAGARRMRSLALDQHTALWWSFLPEKLSQTAQWRPGCRYAPGHPESSSENNPAGPLASHRAADDSPARAGEPRQDQRCCRSMRDA